MKEEKNRNRAWKKEDYDAEMQPGRILLDMNGSLMEPNQLRGRHLDIVTERGLKKRFRDRILREDVGK